MAIEPDQRLWLRIHLTTRQEITTIQNMEGVELFHSTMRIIDGKNILIEGSVPKRMYETLKMKYAIRVLGDVEKLNEEARRYVSETNRYRQR